MITKIINALKAFFGLSTATEYDKKQGQANEHFAKSYQDVTEVNVTAYIAKRLARLAVSDSTVTVAGDTKRAETITKAINTLWKKMQLLVNRALGIGGVVIAPRVENGEIVIDRIAQDRVFIVEKQGEKITKAAFIAETLVKTTVTYQRWTCHDVENGNLIISTKVMTAEGKPAVVPGWDFEDVIIPNVDRVLFSFLKCPTDNRVDVDDYGVPITYGAEPLISRYVKNIKEQDEEFISKRGITYVDERAFTLDPETGKPKTGSKTIKAVPGSGIGEFTYQDHSPAFRVEAYLKRDNDLARKIEKEVGLSSGMLSLPEMVAKTATEVEISQEDTVAVIREIQAAIADFVEDFAQICDILANFYNLSPMGEFSLNFDFNTPFKDMVSEWNRRLKLHELGAETLVALRQYEYTNEDAEESQRIIEEIEASTPSLTSALANLGPLTE